MSVTLRIYSIIDIIYITSYHLNSFNTFNYAPFHSIAFIHSSMIFFSFHPFLPIHSLFISNHAGQTVHSLHKSMHACIYFVPPLSPMPACLPFLPFPFPISSQEPPLLLIQNHLKYMIFKYHL